METSGIQEITIQVLEMLCNMMSHRDKYNMRDLTMLNFVFDFITRYKTCIVHIFW